MQVGVAARTSGNGSDNRLYVEPVGHTQTDSIRALKEARKNVPYVGLALRWSLNATKMQKKKPKQKPTHQPLRLSTV